MKALLLILLMALAITAHAKTAWYYDTERSGEGVVVTEIADGRLAMAFYTHAGKASVPPQVSPPRPTPIISTCTNSTIWFVGLAAVFADDFAIGTLYYDVAGDYPNAVNGQVSESFEVGTFLIERAGDGFDMILESNGLMPQLSIFDYQFKFRTLLTQ